MASLVPASLSGAAGGEFSSPNSNLGVELDGDEYRLYTVR
jgi:hypothetical protein